MVDQAQNLVQWIKDGDYNFEEDWKVVTLFVGGNDLCASCRNEVSTTEALGIRNKSIIASL